MKHLTTTAVLVTLGASLFAATAHAQPLTEQEFRDEIVDRTFKVQRGFMTIRAIHRSDGTSSMRSSMRNSEGSWRFEDGRICVRWERLRNGEERCGTMSRVGNGQYQTANGMTLTLE